MTDPRLIALLVLLAAGGPRTSRAAPGCPTPLLEAGPEAVLTRVHRLPSNGDAEAAVLLDQWLPVVGCLESLGVVDGDAAHEGWLHLAVHLGRLLLDQERVEEARGVFASVESLDPEGSWGRQAADQINILENLQPGMAAPAWRGRTLSGEVMTSADLRGRWVVLDFWATWCTPCVADLPKLKRLQRRFAGEDLAVLGVALDEGRETLERLIASQAIFWPQLWDGEGVEGAIPRLFAVGGPPVFYLLDRQGRIAAGPLGGDRLEAVVEDVLERSEGTWQ